LARDANLGEKISSWIVTNSMKLKRKLGMGIEGGRRRGRVEKKKKRDKGRSRITSLHKNIIKDVLKSIKNTVDLKKISQLAVKNARIAVKSAGGKDHVQIPRIIPVSKTDVFIQFFPAIFAGLSAIGGLAGGASSVIKMVKETNQARDRLLETERHNKAIEKIALKGKAGWGLYMKKYKSGFGLYISKPSKNL